jgi:hypothetical protein
MLSFNQLTLLVSTELRNAQNALHHCRHFSDQDGDCWQTNERSDAEVYRLINACQKRQHDEKCGERSKYLEKDINECRMLLDKPEGKNTLGRNGCRQEDNIKCISN